jgi:hypothetical protein
MKAFGLFFLIIPYFVFSQDIDRSLYREIGLVEASEIRHNFTGTTQYYKSLAHFDHEYYNSAMGNLNIVVYMYPAQFTQLRYYRSRSLGITINHGQIVMLYHRETINSNGGFDSILDYIELVNDMHLIIGTRYIVTENLRLRNSGNLSGGHILTIQRGRTVTVLEIGNEETINGITSNWVKVRLYDDDTEGWCFGGYLGID